MWDEKPLCYKHWREFDRFEISECEKCHWFDEAFGEWSDDDICYQCFDRERRGYPPTPVYDHGQVERQTHYLYILKLDGGQYYVGQTNDLESRLAEHKDGATRSTKGKHAKLVWYEKSHGNRDEINADEAELTRLANKSPRAIRRMVAEFQRPLKLLDLDT